MLPVDLVLVRHGESEGNIAKKHAKAGDLSDFTPEFLARHSSRFRLTDKGKAQAKAAGEWLKANIDTDFDRYYVSEYIRAIETAALLDLPDANWRKEFFLREREWGELDNKAHHEAVQNYLESFEMKKNEPMFWTPPNGENMANLCIRLKWILDTLSRKCSDGRVVIVCHGEVMWGFRILIERLDSQKYLELDKSKDPGVKINNCQIIHYTRRNPETGKIEDDKKKWVRSISPSNPDNTSEWKEIERPVSTNEDLLKQANENPRLVKENS